ncbi:MAG: long-chain fatty acid--CoA ligase [Acidobacteriota bacterium]
MPTVELPPRPHEPVRHVADDASNLGDVLLRRADATPGDPASFEKVGGSWHMSTWRDFADSALRVAHGLAQGGIEPGDRVAILGPTSVDWGVYDFGGQIAGAVTVGVYPKQSPEQLRYLLEHSGSRVLFVADDEEMETAVEAAQGVESLEALVAWNDALAARFAARDARVSGPGRYRDRVLDEAERQRRSERIDPNSAAILVYTSGTTGPPKAAMISHENIRALLLHIDGVLPFYRDDLLFGFLPMAHVTERVLSFYARVSNGVPAAYASDIGKVIDELPEARPTLFGSVPRIFEKLYARIQGDVERAPVVKRKIFRWAESVARRHVRRRLAGTSPGVWLSIQHRLAHRVVYSKIHAAFGGRVRCCITGAAPISLEILEFLWGIDMPILEAYGMTEATVVTNINRLDAVKLGTVGQPVPTIEQRIAEDGEILMRGPLVFLGYFKNPEATAETIIDGWLHSGDIGTIDDEGFLRITDRKKHLIITAGGKNVAPANIERAIKNQSPMISNVHAHGDRRPYICALIAPSPLETLEWGVREGVLEEAEAAPLRAELADDPSARSEALDAAMSRVASRREFQELYRDAVQRGNRELARVERVRRYTVLDRDFSQKGGELTPTMKMKRKAIETKFSELFDRVYDEPEFAIEAETQ